MNKARDSESPLGAADSRRRALDELANVLAQLKKAATGGDLKPAQPLLDRVDAILSEMDRLTKGPPSHPLPPDLATRARELANLHGRIMLILTSSRQGVADDLARLSKGRKALKGYRS